MDTPITRLQQAVSGGRHFLDTGKIVDALGIREGMKVADFGCGSGYFTILLGKKVGKDGAVTGLDIQEAPLESVRSKAKAEGLGNIETIRGNLEVLGGSSLPENSQDLVLMANILFQSSLKSEILKEGKRILKEGGTMLVIEWRKGAGGFGPQDSARSDEQTMRSLMEAQGLTFERTIDSGQFHFGLLYRK